jgi:hypothetical protein
MLNESLNEWPVRSPVGTALLPVVTRRAAYLGTARKGNAAEAPDPALALMPSELPFAL